MKSKLGTFALLALLILSVLAIQKINHHKTSALNTKQEVNYAAK